MAKKKQKKNGNQTPQQQGVCLVTQRSLNTLSAVSFDERAARGEDVTVSFTIGTASSGSSC